MNKIYQLKTQVYLLTSTKTTKQLKSKRPELTKGKDLRRKDNWLTIYNTLKLIDDFHQEQISKEINIKYKFKTIDSNPNFNDLMSNVLSLGNFYQNLDAKLENLEQKIKKNNEF